MLVDARDLKIGDLFVYESSWRPAVQGTYHFRFLRRTSLGLERLEFLAVLERVVKEDMPILADKVGEQYQMIFTVEVDSNGKWTSFEVIERGKRNTEHCQNCAVPLQWASLALRCPKCWKVY